MASVNHRDARGVAREESRLLHRRVAAADDDDGLALEEEAVARRARRDAEAAESMRRGRFARNAEPLCRSARSDYQSLRLYLVPLFSPDGERSLTQVNLVDEGDEELRAEALGLLLELLHEFRPLYAFGEARVVLDLRCDGQLPAGLWAVYDERVEFGARGVDGRGQARGARADDDDFAVQGLFHHASGFKSPPGRRSVSGITRGAKRSSERRGRRFLSVAFFFARVV